MGFCRVHAALIRAVADRVEADVPESAIRQLAENEYQAHLHEIQLRVPHPVSLAQSFLPCRMLCAACGHVMIIPAHVFCSWGMPSLWVECDAFLVD